MYRQHNISLFGLLETKLKLDKVHTFMKRKFKTWKWCSNLDVVCGGRILIIWNHDLVDCTPLEVLPQVIYCDIVDKITLKNVVCNFVYGFNVVAARRSL